MSKSFIDFLKNFYFLFKKIWKELTFFVTIIISIITISITFFKYYNNIKNKIYTIETNINLIKTKIDSLEKNTSKASKAVDNFYKIDYEKKFENKCYQLIKKQYEAIKKHDLDTIRMTFAQRIEVGDIENNDHIMLTVSIEILCQYYSEILSTKNIKRFQILEKRHLDINKIQWDILQFDSKQTNGERILLEIEDITFTMFSNKVIEKEISEITPRIVSVSYAFFSKYFKK